MKKLFVIVLVLSCFQVKAQEFNESFLGFKLAYNASQNSFHNPGLENVEVQFKSGFAAYAFCNISLSEKFSIQPEIGYSQMGTELEETDPVSLEILDTKMSLDYFTIPVLIKFHPIPRLNIFAGPQLDFLYDAKADYDASEDEDLQSQVTSYDFALTVGLEYWFTRYIGLYGRYMLGFQDVNDKNPGVDLEFQTVSSEITNTGFQIGIAVALRGKDGEVAIPGPVTFPADADGDGIDDKTDKCPNQAGTAKYQGCPVPDSDGDTVNDEMDKCPNQKGLAKYQGCPVPDTDGDGVDDEADRCPKTAGISGNMGCPEMILYYSREEAGLDSNDMSNLDIVVSFMERHPDLSIIVEGHTSTPGEDAFNLQLSEKRANDAVDYMVSKGVARARMTPKGMGEQSPVGDNTTDEGRAKSRRVVIRIAQ